MPSVVFLEFSVVVFAVLTLEDERSSDVKTGQKNFQTGDVVWICPSVETIFFKRIYPSRRTSRSRSDLNSHSDGPKRTNGGMEIAKGAMVLHQLYRTTLVEFIVLNSHYSTQPSDHLSVLMICSSSSVKRAIIKKKSGENRSRKYRTIARLKQWFNGDTFIKTY